MRFMKRFLHGSLWLLRQILFLVGLCTVLYFVVDLPFMRNNGTTMVIQSKIGQLATAKALQAAGLRRLMELNTEKLDRQIFEDGTSIDELKLGCDKNWIYCPVGLKQIQLTRIDKWMGTTPLQLANAIKGTIDDPDNGGDFQTQVHTMPDPAFPDGDIVILVSTAWGDHDKPGMGMIIMYHPLQIGGQKPVTKPFDPL